MPTIKEKRAFFLRNTQVSSGADADKEGGFPVTYFVKGVKKFNRFLKDHVPSENVFKKLFESITFKLNQEDTATTSQQGLVKIASDANAISRTSNATNDFTAAVVPHQLPEIISSLNGVTDVENSYTMLDGIRIGDVTRTVGGKSRRVYLINSAFYYLSKFLRVDFSLRNNSSFTVVTGSGAPPQQFLFNVVAGKSYKICSTLFVDTNGIAGLKVKLGGTLIVSKIIYGIKVFENTVGLNSSQIFSGILTGTNVSGTTNTLQVEIDGSFICTGNGTITIDVAQLVSNNYDTKILVGSTCFIEEVSF